MSFECLGGGGDGSGGVKNDIELGIWEFFDKFHSFTRAVFELTPQFQSKINHCVGGRVFFFRIPREHQITKNIQSDSNENFSTDTEEKLKSIETNAIVLVVLLTQNGEEEK